MYQEPTILASFDAEELLGDAHGSINNGSTLPLG